MAGPPPAPTATGILVPPIQSTGIYRSQSGSQSPERSWLHQAKHLEVSCRIEEESKGASRMVLACCMLLCWHGIGFQGRSVKKSWFVLNRTRCAGIQHVMPCGLECVLKASICLEHGRPGLRKVAAS